MLFQITGVSGSRLPRKMGCCSFSTRVKEASRIGDRGESSPFGQSQPRPAGVAPWDAGQDEEGGAATVNGSRARELGTRRAVDTIFPGSRLSPTDLPFPQTGRRYPPPRLSQRTGFGGGRPRRRRRRRSRRSITGGGEFAESGLRDDKGDPGILERDVECRRATVRLCTGRLGPSARFGVEDGQPARVIGTVRVDRGGASGSRRPHLVDPWPRRAALLASRAARCLSRGPSRPGKHRGPRQYGRASRRRCAFASSLPSRSLGHSGEGRVELGPRPAATQICRAPLPPPFAGDVKQGDPEVTVGLHTGPPIGQARPDPLERVGPAARPGGRVESRGGRRRAARSAVISHRRVSDVSGPAAGACGSRCSCRRPGERGAVGLGDAAGPGFVAGEAACGSARPVRQAPGSGQLRVAGRTTEYAAAEQRSAAGVHLLDLADGPGAAGRPRLEEDRHELVKREPRAKVPLLVAGPEDAVGALEVALIADRLAGRAG